METLFFWGGLVALLGGTAFLAGVHVSARLKARNERKGSNGSN